MDEKRQQIIRCDYGSLQWSGGMRAGRNIFFIQSFSKIKQKQHCFRCDDGLAIFKNISDPKSGKVKKDIQKLPKERIRYCYPM